MSSLHAEHRGDLWTARSPKGVGRFRRGASPSARLRGAALPLLWVLAACTGHAIPESGVQLFEGPVVSPLALSADGSTLVRVNPLHNSITVFDRSGSADPYDVPVGVEPVSAMFWPKASPTDPDLVFVVNHISDSISVVDLAVANVVQTIQTLDAAGVTTTNEPTGIAFASPSRAFVTLDQPDTVIVLERNANGDWSVGPIRLQITAQGPRALGVAGNRLYVAAFESGNQTVAASCLDPASVPFDCDQTAAPESKVLPIEVDPLAPDRDLFVFDIGQLDAPVPPVGPDGLLPAVEVVEHLGTLLYGVAVTGSQRVFVTQTDARNAENGNVRTTNLMFDNRLARIDCGAGCGSPVQIDLDAAAGIPVPTPYGIAVSGDGETVLVSSAGADTSAEMPGLFVLDADGALLGAAMVGDIPQGVTLRSDPVTGAAQTAYVWNSIDGSVSVVDLADPTQPSVTETLSGPDSPLPSEIQLGRLAFRSARASSSGTFSCESCHPNGHIDQLSWVLNAPGIPPLGASGVAAPPSTPESRVTLSVRGLRDTLPLHWDGTLGKPADPAAGPVQAVPQSCNPNDSTVPWSIDVSCFLDLVDASLAGVMCEADCPVIIPGRPGELGVFDRINLAAYVSAVAPQPGPSRRPTDVLSDDAREGLASLIVASAPNPNNTGGCTRQGAGCHEFPHGAPVDLANGFSAQPGPWRTMWDRFLIGSNGGPSSNSVLTSRWDIVGYDAAAGPSERASFGSFLLSNFSIGDDEPSADWEFRFLLEMGSGYSGLLGRQLTISPAMVDTAPERAAVLAEVQAFESAALEGRPTTTPAPCWELTEGTTACYSANALLGYLATFPASARVTIRADLPPNVAYPNGGFAGATLRQPLLMYPPPIPNNNASRLGRLFVEIDLSDSSKWSLGVKSSYLMNAATAKVIIDGAVCGGCTLTLTGALGTSVPNPTSIAVPVGTMNPPLTAGLHTLQIQADRGYFSNEIPFKAVP